MKKATKKLIVSAIVLVVVLTLATATTYAWFTMDDEPEVEGFDVNVTSVDGLYISLMPENNGDPASTVKGALGTFRAYVTGEEVIAAIQAYNNGVYLDSETNELKTLTHGTTADGMIFTAPEGVKEASDAETNHYTFRLYFYSTNEYKVKLNPDVSSVTSIPGGVAPVAAWADELSYEYGSWDDSEEQFVTEQKEFDLGDSITADAKDAVRIAFKDGSTTNIWDPNPNTGFVDNTADGNIAFDYYNFVSKTDLVLGEPMANTVTAEVVLTTLTGSQTAGYFGYLDITIWLEGWDANAFNSILNDTIITNLIFKGEVEVEG